MSDDQYPDLFGEALAVEAREVMQALSCVAVLVRAAMRHQAKVRAKRELADEQAKRAQEQREKAERDAIRSQWEPANDRQWLRSANIVEVADAWSAAVDYADQASAAYERSAEFAVNNCEARLRELHPYAMNYFDRLRGEGLSRSDAIGQAAPLFLNHPNARPHEARPRLRITARGVRDGVDETLGPQREEFERHFAERQAVRGTRIVEGMQVRAMAEGRPLLNPDEQRTALDATTNLTPELIGKVVTSNTAVSRRPRRPWENESPFTIQEVVEFASKHPEALVAPAPKPAGSRQQSRSRHA
jgi:hypothetical protein